MNLVYLSEKEEDVALSQISLLLKSYKQSQRLLQLYTNKASLIKTRIHIVRMFGLNTFN